MTRKPLKISFLHLMVLLLFGIILTFFFVLWLGQGAPAHAAPSQEAPSEVVDVDLKKVKGSFALTNQSGVRVTEHDFVGKFLLVYFGYTSCPDMCPTGLQAISRAMDLLGTAGLQVQPLFITVDPARDSASRLRDYLSAFHPKIMALRGNDRETAAAAESFQVDYEKIVDDEGHDEEYIVEHNSPIFLMSTAGKLLSAFPEEAAPQKLVSALRAAMAVRD